MLRYFEKNMRRATRGLYVDTVGINRVKDLIHDNNIIVLLPLYKSFCDFFVLQYINYYFGIESGFTFGNAEDTPKGGIEGSGYVFSKRNEDQSLQSNYINAALL